MKAKNLRKCRVKMWMNIFGQKTFDHQKSTISKTEADDTVDGRNPAPVDRLFIPLFPRFYISQVVSRISCINSRSNRSNLPKSMALHCQPSKHESRTQQGRRIRTFSSDKGYIPIRVCFKVPGRCFFSALT